MKIKLVIAALISLGYYQSYSQSMYAQFSTGYAIPSGSQQIGYEDGYDTNGNYFERSVNGSYGAGINFTGTFGYMFTPSIGLDIGVNYLLGKKYTSSYTYDYFSSLEEDITETKSSGISITPSLLINFGGTKFSPYAKLGVAIGSFTLNEDQTYQFTNAGQVEYSQKSERKTTGEISIGIRGGIGLAYAMSGNLSLFGECLYTGMSYRMKESEVTSYSVNGQDLLAELFEYQKRTIYVEESTGNSENQDEPNEELQTPNPLSSISVNVGIRISFGGI